MTNQTIFNTTRFTDLLLTPDFENVMDATIDSATSDLIVTQGLDTAHLVSLFSDRRATKDEAVDPMRRRGRIGNVVPLVAGDNFGSGLWLYEQSRMTPAILAALSAEVEASHGWMLDTSLALGLSATIGSDTETRTVMVTLAIKFNRDKISQSYVLAQATIYGLLLRDKILVQITSS
jgi:hypothetical protein